MTKLNSVVFLNNALADYAQILIWMFANSETVNELCTDLKGKSWWKARRNQNCHCDPKGVVDCSWLVVGELCLSYQHQELGRADLPSTPTNKHWPPYINLAITVAMSARSDTSDINPIDLEISNLQQEGESCSRAKSRFLTELTIARSCCAAQDTQNRDVNNPLLSVHEESSAAVLGPFTRTSSQGRESHQSS